MSKSCRLLFLFLALLLVAALVPGGVFAGESNINAERSITYAETSPSITPSPDSTLVSVNLPLVMGMPGPPGDKLVAHLSDLPAQDVCVVGNYAYVVHGVQGMTVLDISDPGNPVQVGSYQYYYAHRIHVSNGYAYIAGSNNVRIVDVTDPTHPFEVAVWVTAGLAFDVYVDGEYAYVADEDYGLRILDVSIPWAPFELLGINTNSNFSVHRVYASSGYAYLACVSGWLVADVSVPNDPIVIDGWLKEDLGTPHAVYAAGNNCYFGEGSILWILGSAISESRTVLGACDTSGVIQGLYAEGDYVYAVGNYNGLCVIDVSIPSSPMIVTRYDMSKRPLAVYASRGYIYVADDYGGLYILK